MKKALLLLFVIACFGCSQAKNSDTVTDTNNTTDTQQQVTNNKPGNLQNKSDISKIPPFKLLTVEGKLFTEQDLKKHKPVMIIYFSPDCSHCTKFMEALKPKFNELKNVQIVMGTWIRVEALKPFCDTFGLAKYPNFTVGTEGNGRYMIQEYYQIKETPYIAVYDRTGKLVKAYDKAPKVAELMASIKKT
ncbi:MAG: redoxin domain-containing protein [Sphingobacteriaceae bacterium]|nr:MAG: redoxin domain-containing protein [Sphingobacteriaceae bacterium]